MKKIKNSAILAHKKVQISNPLYKKGPEIPAVDANRDEIWQFGA